MADPVIGLLQKIAGPAADEIGLTLQDSVRVYWARRAYQLAEKVADFYERKGIQPQRIPLRILLPILDAASVEDDETLHSMWANVLCSAAIPYSKPRPYPAFIEVLKQMSREEVIFYNALYEDLEKSRAEYFARPESERAAMRFPVNPDGYELIYTYLRANGYVQEAGSLEEAHNRYEAQVDVAFENLERLGLLGQAVEPGTAPKHIMGRLLGESRTSSILWQIRYCYMGFSVGSERLRRRSEICSPLCADIPSTSSTRIRDEPNWCSSVWAYSAICFPVQSNLCESTWLGYAIEALKALS